MDKEKVIKGLQIERECVSRDCDRDCGKCDLEKLIELIEARIDIADMHKTNFVYFTPAERKRIRAWLCQLKEQQERIERLQPKKGKWLDYAGDQMCSVCGSSYSDLFPEYTSTPFCPHCGAKMEGGDGE